MSDLFATHMLNEIGKARARAIGASFGSLLDALLITCPENTRDFAIVKTKLQEACFFAKRSIAVLPENQEP